MMAAGALLALGALTLAGCDRDDSAPASPPAQTDATPPNALPTSRKVTSSANKPPVFEDPFHDVTGPVQPDKLTAKVIQTLAVFDHPASSVVSLDGKLLFVTNSASIITGLSYNKGSISKLEIDPADGRLRMVRPDFIVGLHAPMGIAALPKATGKFPAGTIFVATGTTAGLDDKGNHIEDIKKFNPGVSIFDPATGRSLGFIPMGDGHAVAKLIRHPVLAPAGLCFDPSGDLYVADGGNTGRDLDPPVIGRPGIIRIANGNIDAMAQDQAQGEVAYLPVRHIPAAVFYSRIDDGLYWTTCDGEGGGGGAVYRLPRKEFPQQNMINNVVGDLGALMGLTITPNGSLIAARLDGDLALVTKKILAQVGFYESASFSSPGDIKLHTLANGYNILYLPEQEPGSELPWKQRLRVILLPSGI
jgi:hypothetical protein